mmetsp:Transcript_23386/g.92935  ORF Transcript_23386/g.92935 Transcript_23386/m.92935 type:complete len:310 (-) Transcript_23386:1175-2104(-)|eukprot:CAMPEP_0113964816 /NCGR_PEP_ID=MMETSP0011_2-20120614/7376_1 /TAXON_ID=101924 /ORGANISM="Rhodosorus marinus" /LENGTH=309 /DNA_ID=CAMNT_0000977213 /DNA_START=104 /DNA_END=1033 /DNA_ORIENTATION=- /assembly_acc=CAM_ASM_000156
MGRDEKLKFKYEGLLGRGNGKNVDGEANARLEKLKELILWEGLPDSASDGGFCGRGSLRGTVWKALLGVADVNVDEYLQLVDKGASNDYQKIFNDVYRTFSKHEEYTSRVPREMLVRLLNAFVHYRGNTKGTYVQSMSVLAAPFLFLMPEPEAFLSFQIFLRERIPEYVYKYVGVHRGCDLLDRCLQLLDPSLYQRFLEFKLTPQMYAFPNISSLGMCVSPLNDSIQLLDVQLAYGSHLGVLFSLGRLLLASEKIMQVRGKLPITTREMENGFGFSAAQVLHYTLTKIIPEIDDDLYKQVEQHTGEKGL